MSFYAVLLLAVALSMDAFAVALASGCALRTPLPRHYFRISAAFGFFQFAMPVVGWYLGVTVRSYIEDWDHFFCLAGAGFLSLPLCGSRCRTQPAGAERCNKYRCPGRGPFLCHSGHIGMGAFAHDWRGLCGHKRCWRVSGQDFGQPVRCQRLGRAAGRADLAGYCLQHVARA